MSWGRLRPPPRPHSREIQATLEEAGPVHLPAPAPALAGLAHLPFIGRTAERAALLAALQAAGRGHGGIALVEGAAGVGETRLVEELVADARWRGFQVGLGRADPLEAFAPYQPLHDALAPLLTPLRAAQLGELVGPLWLSAAAAVLPTVREHRPYLPALGPLEAPQEQQRLWEGHALAGLGRLAEAGESYEAAMGLRRELGRHNLVLESQAGQAWTLLARGRREEAWAQVDEILGNVASCSLNGTEDRFRIYLTCYRVLQEGQDGRAGEILARAYDELQSWAGRLADLRQRRSFLAEVASHREIAAAYEAARQQGPVETRLPRAGAPTGRPLRDDELVPVIWTPALPEDEAIPEKVARRRHCLRRLLEEAAANGAAPTVNDLAAALGVEARTIKRDLAALRAAGHPTPTRGRRGSA